MHWSVRAALHTMTVDSQVPAVAARLEELGVTGGMPSDILAGQLVQGASGTLHSASFEAMDPTEQQECLTAFVRRILPDEET